MNSLLQYIYFCQDGKHGRAVLLGIGHQLAAADANSELALGVLEVVVKRSLK